MRAVTGSLTSSIVLRQKHVMSPRSKTKVKIYQATKVYRQWLVYRRIRTMAAPSKADGTYVGAVTSSAEPSMVYGKK
jgi:hypothetical protein